LDVCCFISRFISVEKWMYVVRYSGGTVLGNGIYFASQGDLCCLISGIMFLNNTVRNMLLENAIWPVTTLHMHIVNNIGRRHRSR
jgi:hypothetical protein